MSASQKYRRGQQARRKKPAPRNPANERSVGLELQRPRKPANASFIAEWPSTCNRCHLEIKKGERARYDPEGELVHHRHETVEKAVEICQTCWLAKPCECD